MINPLIAKIADILKLDGFEVSSTVLNGIESIIVEEANNAYNVGYGNALQRISELNVLDAEGVKDYSEYVVEYVYKKDNTEYLSLSKKKKNAVVDNILPFRRKK